MLQKFPLVSASVYLNRKMTMNYFTPTFSMDFLFFKCFFVDLKEHEKDRCINIQHKFGNITIVYKFLTTYKTHKGVGDRREGRLLLINKKQTSQQPRNALIYSASKKVEKHGKTHLLKRKLQTWKYIIFINRAVFCTHQCAC